MASHEAKRFSHVDEVREFPKGKMELVRIGDGVVGKMTLQPGWRWSEHVKPIAGTECVKLPDFQYHIAGRLHVVMADGAELDLNPGDVARLPSGHDAWVVGNEPVVAINWAGATHYAER